MKKILVCMYTLLFLCNLLKASDSGYQEWQKKRDSLLQSPDVVAYYTFENLKEDKTVLKDLSPNKRDLTYVPYKDPKTKEIFDDLQTIEGRWSEKTAGRFIESFYQGVPLNIENKQFTVEAWFRREGSGHNLPFSSAGFRNGWCVEFIFREGQAADIYFGIGRPEVYYAKVSAKVAISEKIWHHFASTWDGKEMKIFIDGKLVCKEVDIAIIEDGKRKRVKIDGYSGDYTPTKVPFKVGLGIHKKAFKRRPIIDLDEVVIYNRALSEEEISVLGKGSANISEKEIFATADEYIRAKNYKGAIEEYNKLKSLPNFGTEFALFNISETYRTAKDYASVHKTYGEIFNLPNLTSYYRIYGLFRQAEVYIEQKNFGKARENCSQILKIKDALASHVFKAELLKGDTYRFERKYSLARPIYTKLLIQQETSDYPHEGRRTELIERLELTDGLKDGEVEKSRQEKWLEIINSPKQVIYVSPKGKDTNSGTQKSPFATIKRAQEEVRKIREKGLPKGGITIFLREGRYFLTESISFERKDSGLEGSPIVYRSYPGEKVRLIGGVEVKKFVKLNDPNIIRRLPEEARDKVWVANLKSEGITDYGEYKNRGGQNHQDTISALEFFYGEKVMQIARWPNEWFARTGKIPSPDGEIGGRGKFKKSVIHYQGDRPERWLEEKDIWLHGFWYFVYNKDHVKIRNIDTKNHTISLFEDTRWSPSYALYNTLVGEDVPYYAYNLLCELDSPGEWYLDRETGKLYFYPPDGNISKEALISTLSTPILSINGASNIAFFGLTLEITRASGVEIRGGYNNIIASSIIRNTGQRGILVENGWNHTVVGCDIYDNGAGGILLSGGDRVKLIPSRHTAENNHIYRFNRFSGGSYANGIRLFGVGQRASHNLMYESPAIAMVFDASDHIMEYNEIHDAPTEGREIGAIYIYGAHNNWRWLNRGSVIRGNFVHHISSHSSPNLTHGINAIHLDGRNGGLVMENNIFYRFSSGISCSHPDMRIENNIFIDAERRGMHIGERGLDFFFDSEDNPKMRSIISWGKKLESLRYKQPPWSYRYPQLVVALIDKQPMRTKNTIVERNISTGGPFYAMGQIVKEDNPVRNNWDGEEPYFFNRKEADFKVRPGAPVFGLTGYEPIEVDKIGIYKDPLRASWPINRDKKDIGKYYNPDWTPLKNAPSTVMAPVKRISPPAYYNVFLRKNPINIDGKLDKNEWNGLNLRDVMVIDKEHMGEDTKGAPTYAWLLYDKDYLYIGTKHQPDPFEEGMLPRLKGHSPWFEIGIETQHGKHSKDWWNDDMVTGPVYIFTGKINGEFVVHNPFGMPYANVVKLQKSIEYKTFIIDKDTSEWTSEMKIPFADIGINPDNVEHLAFSIGTYKKRGFFNWIPTGSRLWRVENAGFIKLVK
ncbi:right-handed parallel beta-helix repeat-containing protein [bacterium]|nr:right-handed parallel beta-helix repeat-containing protein [bacterium]